MGNGQWAMGNGIYVSSTTFFPPACNTYLPHSSRGRVLANGLTGIAGKWPPCPCPYRSGAKKRDVRISIRDATGGDRAFQLVQRRSEWRRLEDTLLGHSFLHAPHRYELRRRIFTRELNVRVHLLVTSVYRTYREQIRLVEEWGRHWNTKLFFTKRTA